MVRGWWVGWLYSGSRSFEAKFPPASISLKTEGCRVKQVLISRVSCFVPNMVIYIYQNPTKLVITMQNSLQMIQFISYETRVKPKHENSL